MQANVAKLLNEQVNKEFYSAYLYLDFANYFAEKGLAGFANWYNVQAKEEMDHATLMIQYLQNNSENVTLEAVAKPESDRHDNLSVTKQALQHEKYVTGLINNIYHAASEEKDYRTLQFLDWFVKEQGEEEKNASDLILKLETFGADPKGLYLLDQELAARVYAAPSLVL